MPLDKTIVLSRNIAEYTSIFDGFLREIGLPTPNFHASYPLSLPLSPNVAKLKQDVLEGMDELEALLQGRMLKITMPRGSLKINHNGTINLHFTARPPN